MTTTGHTRIITGSAAHLAGVRHLASSMYGAGAHQGKETFHAWCYGHDPHCPPHVEGPVVAVTDDGRVTGMMDKLYMAWNVEGTIMRFPSTCNLAIVPESRKGGLGVRLVLAYMRGEEHVLVSGANAQSAPLYRSLKYQELTGAFWGWRLLAPVRAAWRYGMHRALGREVAMVGDALSGEVGGHPYTSAPDAATLDALALLLNDRPHAVRPHWTAAGLHWRCFHPQGPRHVLVHAPGAQGAMEGALVMAIGRRHGLRTARFIAYNAPGPGRLADLFAAGIAWCRRHDVDVVGVFTLEPHEADLLRRTGFRPRRHPPATFFHHRDRARRFDDVLVQGISWDMGLEGMA